ncbi:MAG: glycoside hydrolase family 25 protein [Flavobacteriales bacterium]|nr:glycoside hydrolase family 25 protein [Flavobacteriales bacterium]MCC6939709.1 glycoside hydrolase family 25 protein [Flavobacteriales bacterium]
MRRWLLGLILLAIIGGTGVALIYFGFLRANYPSSSTYPVRGIDVSHHQGTIDWETLASERFSFVFIKATEGVDYVDPEFIGNWAAAKQNGNVVGAYHFFLTCRPGLEQAEHFIRTAPLEAPSLPPVIDLEYVGYCDRTPKREEVIQEIQACVDRLNDHYGRAPILYVTQDFYSEYIINRFSECPLWIRDIVGKPQLPDGRDWTFWQFANRGHAKGIDGFVDLNVFHGDNTAFGSLIDGSRD